VDEIVPVQLSVEPFFDRKIGNEAQGWAMRDARITHSARAPRLHCFSILSPNVDFISMTSLPKPSLDPERNLLPLPSEAVRFKKQRKILSLKQNLKISQLARTFVLKPT